MSERFFGESALLDCTEVLVGNPAISGDAKVAEQIAEKAIIRKFSKGDVLIEQNATDRDVFFLLSGEVEIEVDGQITATRKTPRSVGEMAAVDPSERRSATVIAKTDTVVVARVEYRDFNTLCDQFPSFLANMNQDIRSRFRERLGLRVADVKRINRWPYISICSGIFAAIASLFIYSLSDPQLQLGLLIAALIGIVTTVWMYWRHEKFLYARWINIWIPAGVALLVFNIKFSAAGEHKTSWLSVVFENISPTYSALVWVAGLIVLCIAHANHRKKFN